MTEEKRILQWLIIAIISSFVLVIKYFDWIIADITNLFTFLGLWGFTYLFVIIAWEGKN